MVKRIMRAFKLDEISAVDRPAQAHAKMAIMKRDFTDKERQALADKGVAMPDGSFPIETIGDLENAVRAIGRANDPAAAKAHIIARAKALGHPELLPDGWVSKSAGDGTNPAHEGENDMDEKDIQKKIDDAVKTATADLTKSVETLTTERDEALAKGKMTDAEKAHFDSLTGDAKMKFLAMSPADRAAALKKRDDADAEVYKAADGTVFRKSDDPRLVAMAKRADDNEKLAKAEREKNETAEFTKRAETEVPHLPGEVSVKAQVLKHLAGAPEAVQKAAEVMLKAGEAAVAKGFTKFGSAGGEVNGDNPEAKLNTLAKAHAEKNSVSFAKAYSAVLDTEEGKRLYAESRQAA